MRESTHFFGKYSHLFGILTESAVNHSLPTIVLWNTGISTHCGPNRINVTLARTLAKLGFRVFRFDLSGLGESEHRRDGSTGQEKNNLDTLDALDYLRTADHGEKFVLIGNCSGAVDAHYAAARDSSVCGLLMVDGYVYPTSQYHVHYYRKRIFNLKRWKNFIERKKKDLTGDNPVDIFGGDYPDKDQTEAELRSVIDRGCKVRVFFTGGFEYKYTYFDQFFDMFPSIAKNDIELTVYPDADHLFTVVEHRRSYIEDVCQWVSNHWESHTSFDDKSLTNLKNDDSHNKDDSMLYRSAVVVNQENYSYKKLEELIAQTANLLESHGISAGDRIGIALPRGIHQIVSVLVCEKMNITYIPIDPSQPKDIIESLLSETSCKLIYGDLQSSKFLNLTTDQIIHHSNCYDPRMIDTDMDRYILFTSGSTGKPKSIALPSSVLDGLIDWQLSQFTEVPRTLLFSPLSFDVSYQELVTTIRAGGTIFPISESHRSDPVALLEFIEEHQINQLYLPFIALNLLCYTAMVKKSWPTSIKSVFTAGEQLVINDGIREFFRQTGARLSNHYGPSETHVVTAYMMPNDVDSWDDLPPIGKPLPGFDIELWPIESEDADETHEIVIGGHFVKGRYLDPALNQGRFLDKDGKRYYKTGDIGFRDKDDNFHFVSRIDHQLKINGYRIEGAAIESAVMSLQGITSAVVVKQKIGHEDILTVFYSGDHDHDLKSVRHELSKVFPKYSLPNRVTRLDEFSRTSSGKIDRKSLATYGIGKLSSTREILEDQSEISDDWTQSIISTIKDIAGIELLADDNIFHRGVSSVQAVKVALELCQRHSDTDLLSAIDLFQHPTPNALGQYLSQSKNTHTPLKASTTRFPQNETQKSSSTENGDVIPPETANSDIAIIGLSGRFPAADNPYVFYQNLLAQKESATAFDKTTIDPSHLDFLGDPRYVPRRGIISDADHFDHKLFGFNPKEAALIDPQHRVFLEEAYNCLIDARCVFQQNRNIGVFAACNTNSYLKKNILPNKSLVERYGDFQIMIAGDSDYLATRVAHRLNLEGPALTVGTACSSSLVAIIQAVNSLRQGQCQYALAGGVSITAPIHSGHFTEEGSIKSPDGFCRPFSKDAKGTYFSDGVGVVMLMPLSQAEKENRKIYGVIRGVGINNDGIDKVSYSSPSVKGQVDCIKQALEDASLSSDQVDFIECHGTGTHIGDPLEVEALRRAFSDSTTNRSPLIGSLKGNIGHLAAAAGVTGLIKASLSLYYRRLPASIHSRPVNPMLKLDSGCFRIPEETIDLGDKPVTAGVSSFGIGGTNSHIIVSSRGARVEQPRSANSFSLFSSSTDPKQKPRQTQLIVNGKYISHDISDNIERPKTALLFPGQGSQISGMGTEYYRNWPAFREKIELMNPIVKGLSGIRLDEIFQLDPTELQKTHNAQLAIFGFSYAIASSLEGCGLEFDIMVGHSIGEYAAAVIGGCLSLQHALEIVFHRGRLMQALPKGGMVALRTDKVLDLPSDIALAANNNEVEKVIAGPLDSLNQYVSFLEKRGIATRKLNTSHAFHSSMMQPMVEEFGSILKEKSFNKPNSEVISTLTGEPWSESPPDPTYWIDHAIKPVDFWRAVLNSDCEQFIEVGPGRALSQIIKRSRKSFSTFAIHDQSQTKSEWESLLTGISLLRSGGIIGNKFAYDEFNQASKNNIFEGYKFDRAKCWFDPIKPKEAPKINQTTQLQVATNMKELKDFRSEITEILFDSSGIQVTSNQYSRYFIEVGLDSLFLTQLAVSLRNHFKCDISFRGLSDEYPTVDALNEYIQKQAPQYIETSPDPVTTTETNKVATITPSEETALASTIPATFQTRMPHNSGHTSIHSIVQQQIQLMQQQLSLLQGEPVQAEPAQTDQESQVSQETQQANHSGLRVVTQSDAPKTEHVSPSGKRFGPMPKILNRNPLINDPQKQAFEVFAKVYNAKTQLSKQATQEQRFAHADPRTVSGFHKQIKEVVYPIHINKAEGSLISDIDGNTYLDIACGFGSMFFGHNHPTITEKMTYTLSNGYAIGPQAELAGPVAERIAKQIGQERIGFCNTGSEAVLGALRIARTKTGRKKVVFFKGAYHGIFDEVIATSGPKGTIPAAPGIGRNSVSESIILDYGTTESLEYIKDHASHIAAILIEPVQSRNPKLFPIEFLRELRTICRSEGITYILDEVITGFRIAKDGINGKYGLDADLVCYGKIIGGSLPIGLLTGNKDHMDHLDGGHWAYGDTSVPEVGVTFFAGTFVRHPLTLAAVEGVLDLFDESDHCDTANQKAEKFVNKLNQLFDEFHIDFKMEHFGSLMFLRVPDTFLGEELFSAWLKYHGVFSQAGIPCFINSALTDKDVESLIHRFQKTIQEMNAVELLPIKDGKSRIPSKSLNDGRFLAMTPEGEPAWFKEDPENSNSYLMQEFKKRS